MKSAYELSDLNHRLIRNFWNISHTMHRISEGKGSQKRILIILRENPGITQRALTEYLDIQPGSASEVIGKLEGAGLLLRTPSQRDRRTAELHLTEAGEAVAKEAHEGREQRHRSMFACLSKEEREELLSLLERLNSSWEQQYQENHEQDKGKRTCGNM